MGQFLLSCVRSHSPLYHNVSNFSNTLLHRTKKEVPSGEPDSTLAHLIDEKEAPRPVAKRRQNSDTKPICWCRKSDSPVRDGLHTKRVVSRQDMRREQDGLVLPILRRGCHLRSVSPSNKLSSFYAPER